MKRFLTAIFFLRCSLLSQGMTAFCRADTPNIRSRLIIEIKKMTANILSKEKDFLTLVIYTPKPLKPPSHSATTAPMME